MSNDFTTVAIAYGIVFAGIAFYVLWLDRRSRTIREEIAALRAQVASRQGREGA